MKRLLSFALSLCMATAICVAGTVPASASDEEVIELKMACHDPSTSMMAEGLEKLSADLAEATDGRVVIKGYYDASLGSAADGITMLDTGVCDVLWTTTSFFAGQFPMCEIFTMPMLNPGNEQNLTNAFWDLYENHPEYFDVEFEDYVPIGLYVGGRGAFNTTFEVNGLKDYEGKTMRAVTGPLNNMANSLGINPVMMAPPDLFLSMEKGVIDGFMAPYSVVHSFSLEEVVKHSYIYGSSTFDNNILILMTKDTWDKISPEDQETILSVYGREGSLYLAGILGKQADIIEETLGDRCTHITEGEDFDTFSELAKKSSLEYLDQYESDDVPTTDAYNYVLERIEYYKAQ